jgi:hypothetical protein
MSESDLDFLARKGVFWLPDEHLRGELIQAFFDFVYPFMPLLDKDDLIGAMNGTYDSLHRDVEGDINISDEDQPMQVSLLLFQAIMFAGSPVSKLPPHHPTACRCGSCDTDMPLIVVSQYVPVSFLRALGYDTRKAARDSFYWRTRILYDFDVEQDQIAVLQTLLLMSFWYEEPNDTKDCWYWIGAAASLVQVLGLWEMAGSTTKEGKLFKRIWWSSFVRDALLSMAMTRPMRHQKSMLMLTLDDFNLPKVDPAEMEQPGSAKVERGRAIVCIEMAKLAVCISHVLSHVLGTDDDATSEKVELKVRRYDSELTNWYEGLPKECRWPPAHERIDVPDDGLMVARTIMLMVYHTTVNTLHLPQLLPTSLAPAFSGPPKAVLQGHSRKVRHAAYEVTQLAEILLQYDLVKYLPVQT